MRQRKGAAATGAETNEQAGVGIEDLRVGGEYAFLSNRADYGYIIKTGEPAEYRLRVPLFEMGC